MLAIEEASAELALQVGDPIAQRRLRHAQRVGGLALAARVADGLDVEQVTNVHGGHLFR